MSSLKILMVPLLPILLISQLLAENGHKEYLLMVNIAEKKLFVYQLEGGDKKELASYVVAVPKNVRLPLPLYGKVTRIEINPFWYPTGKTRAYYLRKGIKLPKVVRPGDSRNAMGKAKILINFKNFSEPIRIHGTNDPKSIGKSITRGCIRLHNKDILSLIEIIRGSKVRVVIVKA